MNYKYSMELFGSEDAIDSMIEMCNKHVMSMHTCANICKLMAPLCDEKSPRGAIGWLEKMLKIREDSLKRVVEFF